MTGNRDNILTRWSRRKLATRFDETPAAPEREHAPGERAAGGDPGTSLHEPELPEREAAEAVESLPQVKDLTAGSDIAAFLKKGVPMALKQAALRKMWSLDPGIRDYVGPSEYAWDFNQPGSMAGFDPLHAKETFVGFLSTAARAIDTVAEPVEAAQAVGHLHEESANAPLDYAPLTDVSLTQRPPTNESSGADTPTLVAGTKLGPSVDDRSGLQSSDRDNSSQLFEPLARPRHGGAMPR
jgi:hypothetical protein